MSPEQVRSQPADAASDIFFFFGCVAEMVTSGRFSARAAEKRGGDPCTAGRRTQLFGPADSGEVDSPHSPVPGENVNQRLPFGRLALAPRQTQPAVRRPQCSCRVDPRPDSSVRSTRPRSPATTATRRSARWVRLAAGSLILAWLIGTVAYVFLDLAEQGMSSVRQRGQRDQESRRGIAVHERRRRCRFGLPGRRHHLEPQQQPLASAQPESAAV